MKSKYLISSLTILFTLISCTSTKVPAYITDSEEKEFLFKYSVGDTYNFESTVNETVKINGIKNHTAEIVNKAVFQIVETDEKGRGFIIANYSTAEISKSSNSREKRNFNREYESQYWRDIRGNYEIEKKYFMPVVRNMPVFPDYAIKPGDSWIADGYEAHDLRRTFKNEEPYMVPFSATYTYLGDKYENERGKIFQVISVNYSLFCEYPILENDNKDDFLLHVQGESNQLIWWDYENGQIDHYTEDFKIHMKTVRGNKFDFSGKTTGKFLKN